MQNNNHYRTITKVRVQAHTRYPMHDPHGQAMGYIIYCEYRKTSNISRTLVGNKIVHNSDVVGASPVGAAPTTLELKKTEEWEITE